MAGQYIVDRDVVSYSHSICEANDKSVTQVKKSLCALLGDEARLDVNTIAKVLQIDKRTVFRYRAYMEALARRILSLKKAAGVGGDMDS
ncbi:MAG: hypothetical protein LBP22_08915 [Deltaproteobacteria bacterium]|jgi:hypothetical protein|nr:hypothetical protein [Deltaproteobacteria bacterium]